MGFDWIYAKTARFNFSGVNPTQQDCIEADIQLKLLLAHFLCLNFSDHPQDVILIAITAILLLLHAVSIFFAHPGITRCFAIIIFWPPALNLPIRLVKLFILSQPYPDTKWLFFPRIYFYTFQKSRLPS